MDAISANTSSGDAKVSGNTRADMAYSKHTSGSTCFSMPGGMRSPTTEYGRNPSRHDNNEGHRSNEGVGTTTTRDTNKLVSTTSSMIYPKEDAPLSKKADVFFVPK